MSLAIRRDKDGNFIRPSKEDIQREKSRMDRLKRRAADYKRKKAEEKRLDRKNVRTPPGKPGVGIGRKKQTRTKRGDAAAAAKLREFALKKLREGQVKKEKAKRVERPGGSRTGLRVTPKKPSTPRRKVPGIKVPGSGTRVRRPAPGFPKGPSTPRRKVPGVKAPGSGTRVRRKPVGILDRKNPVTRKFMNRLVRGGRRSQPKQGKGL